MSQPEFGIRNRTLSDDSSYSITTIGSITSIKLEQDIKSSDYKICNFYKILIAYFIDYRI